MRRLFAIGMLLAVALLTGCGTDYKLPTESPKGRAVPSDGSYQMLSTWTGMNDVQDILLTQGSSSQLFILFNHGGSGTTSRGEVRAYALTRPEVLAGYDFHVPADTPFNPVALASGGDGIAASANNRIYVLSRGDTCLARQNPNTGNCSDTTGGFRNKVTHLEYYWRVFEYRLLAGDTVSSFTDTTMAYVSGVAADAMGRVYVGGIAIVSVPSQIDPTLSERVYQSRVYRYVHGGSDPNMPGANWHRDHSWQVEEGSGVGTLQDPHGLFWSPAGAVGDQALYAADFGKNWIQKLSDQTTSTGLFIIDGAQSGTSLQGPTDVAVDLQGFIYVADAGNHRVLRYSPLASYVQRVDVEKDASGRELVDPIAVAADDSLVYVADPGTAQVIRYKRRP